MSITPKLHRELDDVSEPQVLHCGDLETGNHHFSLYLIAAVSISSITLVGTAQPPQSMDSPGDHWVRASTRCRALIDSVACALPLEFNAAVSGLRGKVGPLQSPPRGISGAHPP